MKLRLARVDDAMAIRDVERSAAAAFAATVHAHLARPDERALVPAARLITAAAQGNLLVAESEDALVGFALLGALDADAHLLELDVLPAHASRGLGSALLDACCARASAAGADRIVLTTFNDVPFNAPFYARRGFQTLAPADLTPSLRAMLAIEIAAGFAAGSRCAMARTLGETHGSGQGSCGGGSRGSKNVSS